MLKYLLILFVIIILPKGFFSQAPSLSNEKDEKVIKENLDNCTNSIKKIYKRWLDGKDFIEEEYNLLQSCYTNFYDQIKINEDHQRLYLSLLEDKKIMDNKVSGGLVGLKYFIYNERGTLLGVVHKKDINLYQFKGEKGMTFIQAKNNQKVFRDNIKERIYLTLNFDKTTQRITIIKGDDNDGVFRIN
jgi:hypothetical protein